LVDTIEEIHMKEAASLLELQRLDLEIAHGKKRLEELPEKQSILVIRHKLRDVAVLRQKAGLLVGKLNADLKAHQDEIESLTVKIDAEQAKVMSTADHRAVATLTREMDGLRRRREKLEMESLGLMDRIEKATAQSVTIDSAIEQLTEKEAAAIAEYKSVGGALQAETAGLEAERIVLAGSVDAETLGRYEGLREGKGGVAVGRLDGDTCSACRMSLPAERISELTSGPDVATCPHCHRLIVVRVDGE
jgi:predicted  nucleic acid-binding Zn-ribbon protein